MAQNGFDDPLRATVRGTMVRPGSASETLRQGAGIDPTRALPTAKFGTEGGREGGRKGGREGGREGGMEGGREGWKEGEREG